jgi:hypothetical protein
MNNSLIALAMLCVSPVENFGAVTVANRVPAICSAVLGSPVGLSPHHQGSAGEEPHHRADRPGNPHARPEAKGFHHHLQISSTSRSTITKL